MFGGSVINGVPHLIEVALQRPVNGQDFASLTLNLEDVLQENLVLENQQ